MKLDTEHAAAFFRWWAPEGPWVVTAIPVTKKATDTATFTDEAGLAEWLKDHERDNCYFAVNPLLREVDKKAARSDVKELAWLHVDIDQRPGEDLEEERERALKLLTTNLPPGVPPPSCIVDSGGGYQGFWRINDPYEINGQEALYEEAKRWNMQMVILYDADVSCSNVDRIMRIPGTVNWPTARKLAKGRVPVEARVVEMNDLAYDLSVFTPAPEVAGGTQGFTSNTVKVSGNVQKLASVDELGDKVGDLCKVVIVQGHDPDDPDKWPSRSEALFWVCCELVRADVDDDAIYSVLMDGDFGISASVLENGSNAGKYALRQIERAREEAIDPWLRKLNEDHAVVLVGGRTRVLRKVTEKVGEHDRSRIDYMSFADFTNFYCNETVKMPAGGGKFEDVSIAKWWLTHENRRTYDNVLFSPSGDIPGAYNLWEGFAFDAKPGDCQMLLAHLGEVICDGNTESFDYVMGWMATAVQRPAQPGHAAIVMRGRQGTGKNTFADAFGALFGRHYLYVRDSNHLFGQFNSHLQDCLVLFADEAFWAGNKKHEGLLKSLITEHVTMSEKKGLDAVLSQNFVKLLMASNEDWIVPANVDDRRFLVLDVNSDRVQDFDYFSRLKASLKAGGYEALLHRLMTHDISEFNVRQVPQTEVLQEQKVRSFGPETEWWYQKLVEGRVFPDDSGWQALPFKGKLVWDFVNHARAWGYGTRSTSTRLGMFMKTAVPPGWNMSAQLGGSHAFMQANGELRTVERPHVYRLPSLKDCRSHFDANFGGPFTWLEPEMVESEDDQQEEF